MAIINFGFWGSLGAYAVEAFAPQTFDGQANLTAPNIRDVLARHLDQFAAWIRRVGRPRDFVRFQCEMDIQLAAR